MKLKSFSIKKYRSIDEIEIAIPEQAPLVLFGPNNAGKSNILSALNCLLGERWPLTIEMQDSDYFMRNQNDNPLIQIGASFDQPLYSDRNKGPQSYIEVDYWSHCCFGEETRFVSRDGSKAFPKSTDRQKCQTFLIEAERNISQTFSYGSRYSLLSKFTHRVHDALTAEKKNELNDAFSSIKDAFTDLDLFKDFESAFSSALKESVKGFVHSLEVDFSAYDPNNYANSIRILAVEGTQVRAFDELGTGEQQILLMAFAKAYMDVVAGQESFVLIVEEPEAHLHPLAQRWLKQYMYQLCKSGIQVIISTHSPEYLDPDNLEGLVRVYKENGVTKAKQLSCSDLVRFCVQLGVPEPQINETNIAQFYATKVDYEQLRGMFSETVLLVEGKTESLALPVWFERKGFSLPAHGIEIVACGSKDSIPLLYRLYQAYGYRVICLFDGDMDQVKYDSCFKPLFGSESIGSSSSEFNVRNSFAYFNTDYEGCLGSSIVQYETVVEDICASFHISKKSKPGVARAVAINSPVIPSFIDELIDMLEQ